jgi:hypothetical protein
VVESTGLENQRRLIAVLGFESLTFRQKLLIVSCMSGLNGLLGKECVELIGTRVRTPYLLPSFLNDVFSNFRFSDLR